MNNFPKIETHSDIPMESTWINASNYGQDDAAIFCKRDISVSKCIKEGKCGQNLLMVGEVIHGIRSDYSVIQVPNPNQFRATHNNGWNIVSEDNLLLIREHSKAIMSVDEKDIANLIHNLRIGRDFMRNQGIWAKPTTKFTKTEVAGMHDGQKMVFSPWETEKKLSMSTGPNFSYGSHFTLEQVRQIRDTLNRFLGED